MRVVFDATALGSELGGDETYLAGMLEGLALCAPESDQFPLLVRHDAPAVPFDAGRFPVRRIKRRPGFVHYALGLRSVLASERGRADLVHTITHGPLASPLPLALTIGDLSFRHHPEHYPPSARIRLNTLVPRQCRAARIVLTPSEFSRRDIIETYDLDPRRVAVVPNRVLEHVQVDDVTRARSERRLREHGVRAPYVLYLGNLHPRKNVARLIDAYRVATDRNAELRDVQLVIAGGRWFKGGVEEAAAARVGAGQVILTGRVDDDVRRVLLEDAVALTYVSMFEGFGLPPIEAMAAGTPVLAGDRAATPEVCGDAALLVDPFDIDAIATGLDTIVTDESRRTEMRERGRARAAMYDVRRTGRAAYSAFVQAVAGTDGPVPAHAGGWVAEHTLGPASGGREWRK